MWLCLVMALTLLAADCTIRRQTEPQCTTTEEMQISTAADRAVSEINLTVLRGERVFVDASHYEGLDHKYTVAAAATGGPYKTCWYE